jgi:hypothetical protein
MKLRRLRTFIAEQLIRLGRWLMDLAEAIAPWLK